MEIGLGLSVCYRIAQRHQAAIEIETSQEDTYSHLMPDMQETAVKALEVLNMG